MLQRLAKEEDLADELQGLRVVRGLREARDLEDKLQKGMLLRDSSCRLSENDYKEMAWMWESPEFAPTRVKELRKEAMVSPSPPAPGVRQRLEAQADNLVGLPAPPRIWVSSLCRLRSSFYECGLVFADDGQPDRAFAFLYATQQPMMAELLPLAKARRTMPSAGTADECLACLNQYYEHQYTFEVGASVDAADVSFEPGTQIFVIPDLAFLDGRKVVSHAEMVPLLEFVTAIMDTGARPTAKASGPGAPKIDRALAEEFPWLTNYLSEGRERHEGGSSSGGSKPPDPKILGRDDSAIDEAFDELQAKRTEWAATYDLPDEHFKVTLMGGAWTKEHKGVSADGIRAFDSGKVVRAWCKQFRLPADATFALKKFGEDLATSLAIDWCHRLEYFYSLCPNAAKDGFEFTAEMIIACPPPKSVPATSGEAQHVRARLAEIAAMAPKAVSTSSSSGLAR